MAQYQRRTGKEAAAAAATRSGGGKFAPTFQFDPEETVFLQFLTSWEEIPTVLMHRFITVGFREDGSKIYRDFISPLDESIDGANGRDPLVDRFGSSPKAKCIGLAVQLEPKYKKQGSRQVIEDWKIAMRTYTDSEGVEKEVPNVALVIESPYTFFGHLGVVDDTKAIEESILSITRKGKKTDTQYTIIPVADALSDDTLAEAGVDDFFEEFDFDGYLDELSDPERLHAEIDPLPDDFVVNPYANKGKGKSAKSGASTRARRTPDPDPQAEDGEDGAGDGGDDSDAEGDVPPRRRRFNQLRTEVGAT